MKSVPHEELQGSSSEHPHEVHSPVEEHSSLLPLQEDQRSSPRKTFSEDSIRGAPEEFRRNSVNRGFPGLYVKLDSRLDRLNL